jgi:hypothetical protein
MKITVVIMMMIMSMSIMMMMMEERVEVIDEIQYLNLAYLIGRSTRHPWK